MSELCPELIRPALAPRTWGLARYTALAPAHEALLIDDFWMLNGVGDYFDLIPATTKAARKDFASMTDTEVKEFVFKTGHCSALIKLLGDFSNVYFSHASWWSYRSMIRMMKHYKTPLHDAAVASKRMSFSSYPGFLESLDDFYILGSGQRNRPCARTMIVMIFANEPRSCALRANAALALSIATNVPGLPRPIALRCGCTGVLRGGGGGRAGGGCC